MHDDSLLLLKVTNQRRASLLTIRHAAEPLEQLLQLEIAIKYQVPVVPSAAGSAVMMMNGSSHD
jgi:hypothetical protein